MVLYFDLFVLFMHCRITVIKTYIIVDLVHVDANRDLINPAQNKVIGDYRT